MELSMEISFSCISAAWIFQFQLLSLPSRMGGSDMIVLILLTGIVLNGKMLYPFTHTREHFQTWSCFNNTEMNNGNESESRVHPWKDTSNCSVLPVAKPGSSVLLQL